MMAIGRPFLSTVAIVTGCLILITKSSYSDTVTSTTALTSTAPSATKDHIQNKSTISSETKPGTAPSTETHESNAKSTTSATTTSSLLPQTRNATASSDKSGATTATPTTLSSLLPTATKGIMNGSANASSTNASSTISSPSPTEMESDVTGSNEETTVTTHSVTNDSASTTNNALTYSGTTGAPNDGTSPKIPGCPPNGTKTNSICRDKTASTTATESSTSQLGAVYRTTTQSAKSRQQQELRHYEHAVIGLAVTLAAIMISGVVIVIHKCRRSQMYGGSTEDGTKSLRGQYARFYDDTLL